MIQPARFTWAAVVILFSSGILLVLGIFALSDPSAARTISVGAVVIGAWGIVTGIGLFALWSWARTSALIAGGLSAYVGFISAPLIPFLQFPVPSDLGVQITAEEATETTMRFKMILLFLVLLLGAFGFWLAHLFSSSSAKELFGVPATTPSPPFWFSVVGWYLIISAIAGIWSICFGVRHRPAIMMEFGSLLVGWSALVVRASYTAVQLFLGGSLLRSREQGRRFAIYYLSFECLDIIVFLLRPGREVRIAAYHDMLAASGRTFYMSMSTALLSRYMRAATIEWAIFALISIWFLAKQNNALDPENS